MTGAVRRHEGNGERTDGTAAGGAGAADAADEARRILAHSGVTADLDVRRGFARDASGLELVPDLVARPTTQDEARELLRMASADALSVTPAGAQTSTTAASITDTGILLSLRGCARVLDLDPVGRTVRVEAGALVADVRRLAESHGLLFTPDPTSEHECTVGGAIACNASGARSLRYGATGPHVRALVVALASGERLELRRPALEKNTVGYPVAHDPVDWFIGSEGTLGVVLEAEFALRPLPEQVIGLAIPFPDERAALAFVVAARTAPGLQPRCLEYFDHRAMAIVRTAEGRGGLPADGALDDDPTSRPVVYAEETGVPGTDALPLDGWLALAEAHGALVDDIGVYDSAPALAEARRLRHAVPATMNERGARYRPAGGRKVSTDWAVPYPHLAEALRRARDIADAHGVPQAVAYGHAGNGHPHQNFLAHDAAELHRIEQVVEATLREVIAMGGTVAAEHGIGKLKRRWLPMQLSARQQSFMRAIKRELDPQGLLAPGNVL
jgi:FAD/FMN-containing dehydrogenase